MLIPYYTTRLLCATCGTFEMGTRDRLDGDETCPWCDGELQLVATCRGMTSRPLPFTSDPRTGQQTDTALDVIGDQISDKRQRNHGHGKSTGRKRGGEGRATYRSANDEHDKERDRARYQERKAQRADDLSGPTESQP